MNLNVYLFGELGAGYTQYPDDYSKTIFEKFFELSRATTQVIIHRVNDLMYYGYIRKLENNQFIGICVVINGRYIPQIDNLFSLYEQLIELMVKNGYFIHYDDKGEIISNVSRFCDYQDEVDLITQNLQVSFSRFDKASKQLPPVNYNTSNGRIKNYVISDDSNDIVKSSFMNGFTFIYKSKDYNTAAMNTYKGIIERKEIEIKEIHEKCNNLKSQIIALKARQKNFRLVGILLVIVFVLGMVIWDKVLFPSRVTNYDAGEYTYYGPMKDGKPNGIGVAIYPDSDKDGRLYYYGNFNLGERSDTSAIMFYKDGSYFRGTMVNDRFEKGILFDVNKEHFVGVFVHNNPWTGTWYKHVPVQTIKEGR